MADGSIVIDTRIDSSGAEKGVSKLNSIASKGAKIFTGVAVATGTALMGLGAYAIKVGSNFEEGMSKVSAISGATGEDLKKLTEKAKEMGAKTKFSATESAEAMQYMAMAGWKTGDMLNGIDGIMNLAAASGEDLALVSDIVTDALTAFGMSAKDSAQFADLLASAASNSNTNVSMLGESFKYVAPVAGALGHSAKDTAFALGLMANAGIKGSQSGTALRASLTNLAHPSKNMAAEMDKLGISLTDSNGKVKEGKALYDELRQKFSGLTDAQKTSSAATIFGKEAMSGMLAIINASDADYKKLYENLSNCDGAAENMANTMNDNLKGQITLLSSALESLGIELYEGVNNPMKEVVKTANEMVQQLTTAFKEGGLTSLVTELGNVFATIITNIAAQLPQMINLAVQVIQSFITGIQNNLPLIATSAIQIIQTLITGFITVLPQIIQVGLQLIIQLGTGIAQAIPTLLPQIINVVIGIADMIISNIGTIIEVGIKILMALVQGLVQALPQLIQEVPRIINEFSGAIFAQLPTIIVAGVKIILMLIKGLIQSIPTLIANIPQIIMAIFNALTLFNWASAGKTLITKVGSGIKGMAGNIGNIARGVAQGVNNVLKNIFTGGLNIGRSLMTNLGSGIRSLVGSIAGTAKSIGSSVVNAIKNAFAAAPSIGKNLIQGIWNGIKSMGNWIMGLIGDFASGIIAGIKEKFKIHSPSRVMRDEVGVMLAKGIGVGVDIETPKVTKDILDNMDNITAKMQATVYQEQARTSRAMTARVNKTINNTKTINNNDNGVTQINNIYQPVKSPAETARALKKVGRDLALGY
ncbi:phage tail tape measure protein [Clostridium sporogenes]|uniref:phage tail tape measure protein n=1 Tax=Clostridium sporogenes TaxID=1509 RepID=UPI0013CC45A6|nr:phage tail tape measure protein [Clostridium sporogenes]MCW6061441.1 phage tail tape measure protein [Clostridium sporogenes]MCW6066835.1 phage tail tape measure protein [Clostridium sporogenes]NFQ01075.1 phage tail tape measure protein [Clostridium sporogenes]NFQ42964.1 phage tail tape measure protein [Clostridium sporogenes]